MKTSFDKLVFIIVLLASLIAVSLVDGQDGRRTGRCQKFRHKTAAGLSTNYAVENATDLTEFPNLLTEKPRKPINATPYWGLNSTRPLKTRKLAARLKKALEKDRGDISSSSTRRRRSTQDIIQCYEKNSETSYGGFRICAECLAITTLDSDRLPRYINEVICNPDDKDLTGFYGEGPCVQKTVDITVQKDVGDGTYEEETYSMGTACEFQMYKSSVLMTLN